jgi:subtilisin family serine protease
MPRRAMIGTLLSFVLLLALGAQHLLAQIPPTSDAPRIRLRSVTFDPGVGEPPISQALRAAATSGRGIYLVQFAGPVQESWKAATEQAGAKLYGYVPDYAFIGRIDAAALAQVRALPFVRWVGLYHPAYRLAPELANTPASDSVQVAVETLPDADLNALAAQVAGWGGTVDGRAANALAGYIRATLPANRLDDIASQLDVVWVDRYLPPRLFNDIAGGQIMHANAVRQSLGLFGAGQTVAVADTGLDVGNLNTLHQDLKGRVVKTYCLGRPSPCDWSDPEGHGTHVSGSVLGNGSASGSNSAAHQYGSSFAGVAPEAKLVMQSIEAADGTLNGIPSDTGDLMRQAYADGARIHTNSWGGPTGGTQANPQYGGYVVDSQLVDQAAWEHKDMLILFAAGNQGTDQSGDGVIDPDSVGQPGTAKNVITVGASENERAGGYNPGGPCNSWGDCWPTDFGVDPLASDTPSNNRNGMAAFSSRGPADDGRIKPELVAPGTNIVSVRSQHPQAGTGWGVYDSDYIYEGGTSMATPLTAGAAAIVREWLTRIKGVANPSAALMKSVMINGAADMSPGQYGTGGTQEIPSRRPNSVAGWGRVDLQAALDPPAPRKIWFDDHTTGLSTGQSATYQVTVSAAQAQQASAAVPASSIRTHRSTSLPLVGATGISPQGTTQLVQNPGFENATFAPWQTFGNPTLDTTVKHSGARSAHMGGTDDANDQVFQTLSVPASPSDVTIDFWYRLNTTETFSGADFFCYGLYDQTGQTAYVEHCGDIGQIGDRDWTRETYSLTPSERASVAGKPVLLAFYVQTDALSLPSEAWVDDTALNVTTASGSTPTATATVATPQPGTGGPLRVTLAWTDYPGEPAAAKALVNDLDLEIIAPNGTHYYGNQGTYTSGQCLRDSKWDACNNTEGVILPQAAAGTYTIIVHGTQVAQGGQQPFGIVASGNGLQHGAGTAQQPAAYLPLIIGSGQALSNASDFLPPPVGTPTAAPRRAGILNQDKPRTR